MRNSEAAQKKQTHIYSGLTITNKPRTKVLKYLLKDRYTMCKYISFDDEKSLKQVRNFLVWRERGKAIRFDYSSQNSKCIKIDMPYFDSVSILQQQNLPRLIRNLIGKLILATNLNLYSIDNIMNNPITGEVSLNNISIVGIIALWKQTEFAFEEFKEIFELLTVDVFDQPTFDRKFPYKLKFRALGMVILKHICRKDISLLKAIFKQNIPSKIKFVEGRQLCEKLPELFREILSNHEIRKKILDAQKRDSLNYGSFLQQVFLETQLSGKQTLDWQRVISLLISGSDLQYIFMEYYNALNDQTKEQLKSLGIQQIDWQKLFKLSTSKDIMGIEFVTPEYVQNRVSVSIISMDLQQATSQISCQMLIRKDFDLYHNNRSNQSKIKLQKLGVTKELYLYFKLKMPNFIINLQKFIISENYQMKINIFNSLSKIVNDNEELRRLQDINQCSEVNMKSHYKQQISETLSKQQMKKSLAIQGGGKDNIQIPSTIKANEIDNNVSYGKQPIQLPSAIFQKIGKQLLAVPLEYKGGNIKGINKNIKMMNKFLRL